MRIAATTLSMEAARTYTEVNTTEIGMQQETVPGQWVGQGDPFSERFRNMISAGTGPTGMIRPSAQPSSPSDSQASAAGPAAPLESLASRITGQPVRILSRNERGAQLVPPSPAPRSTATIFARVCHVEEEEVMFSASGTVETEDGASFSFTLDLSMERRTSSTSQLTLGSSLLLDPLVLNLDGELPGLTETSFLFDLDADGEEEMLPGLEPGCGFLALDRNGDGRINNGSELFGPLSGNGFSELAEFDVDGNLWIDENDPIFSDLSVWTGGEEQERRLVSLAEAGVGAISLTRAGTSFSLLSRENDLLGQVSASGIFLTEDGEVRSLQEIDLSMGPLEPEELEGAAGEDRLLSTPLDAITSLRFLAALQRMRLRIMMGRQRIISPGTESEIHLEEIFAEMRQERERFLLEVRDGATVEPSETEAGLDHPVAARQKSVSSRSIQGAGRLLRDILQPLVAVPPVITLDKRLRSS